MVIADDLFPYATVCSGAEAFGKEWEGLGFKAVFHAEIEPHASAVLRYHYPNVPNYGDFTQIATVASSRPVQPVRLLCGGTPCQDFSIAGLRAGVAGDKGSLTLEFLLLAQRLRPEWILWENVPGVFSALSHDAPDCSPPQIDLEGDDGPADGEEVVVEDEYEADESHAFHSFLAGLSELGYQFAYRTLDLQNWGVPQRRKRVFVVAHISDWARAAAVLFEPHCLPGNFTPGGSKGAGVTQALTRRLGSGGPDDNLAQGGFYQVCTTGDATHTLTAQGFDASEDGTGRGMPIVAQAFGGNNTSGPIDVATCLNAHGGGPCRLDFESETFLVDNVIPFDTTQVTSKANQSRCDPGSACHTLSRGAHAPAVAFGWAKSASQTMQVSDVADPVLASPNAEPAVFQLLQGSAVRRLMPIETERLMGWADEWTRYGIDAKGRQYELADGPRYRICGNGWGAPVVTWIAARIKRISELFDDEGIQ